MVTVRTAWDVASTVPDPEIPMLSIDELGILRSVETEDDGRVTVTITPTYSGCPAMREIERMIVAELSEAGYRDVHIVTKLSPAWTTDWMTNEAKDKLAGVGIAPPSKTDEIAPILCPQCSSSATDVISPFGSTACKALMVCSTCGEPFDHFKSL